MYVCVSTSFLSLPHKHDTCLHSSFRGLTPWIEAVKDLQQIMSEIAMKVVDLAFTRGHIELSNMIYDWQLVYTDVYI